MAECTAVCCLDPENELLLLVSRYSDGESILTGIEHYIISNLSARRGIDGPQIILTWEPPIDPENRVTLIRIVRKLYDFPINENDGTVVFEGPKTVAAFADCEDVPANKCIYYKVWSYIADIDEWISLPRAEINIVALYTGNDHWRKLFYALGENILVGDKDLEHSQEAKIPLSLSLGPDGECFNMHETGERKGQLARFYKIMGALLDEAKELIGDIKNQRNPNEACYQYLDLMATLLGFEINRDIPIPRRRLEVKNRVKILKIKGTLASITTTAQSITGFQTSTKEWCKNVFIMNKSRLPALDPVAWKNKGTANDSFDYLIDLKNGARACNTVSIFIDLKSSEACVPPYIINKLERSLKEVLPICVNGDIYWNDEVYREDIELPTEDYESDIDDYEFELPASSQCWWTFNDPVKGVFNSTFVLPSPFGVCKEISYDIIDDAVLVSNYTDPITDVPN